MSALPLTLHVWPGHWGLPSIDAGCIETILYLQLTFPNCYSIVETADPDLSPSGQLPFLTHGELTVSSLPAIILYLSSLDPSVLFPADPEGVNDNNAEPFRGDLDSGLSSLLVSQAVAWRGYVEVQLGDLVTHSFFVLDPNYRTFTHGLLASMLPVPQRYYVPNRIKEGHRPRLEAAGLWQIANEPKESEEGERNKGRTSVDKERLKHTFGQAKLVEKARLVFDLLSRLLNEKSFVFNDRPRAIDLALASRILLITKAPLPNSELKGMLESSYPNLVAHATHIYALAFPSSLSLPTSMPPILALPRVNLFAVFRSSFCRLGHGVMSKKDESEEEKRFRRYRWGWIGMAMVGAAGFLVANGFIRVERVEIEGEEGESQTVIEDGELEHA